MRPTERVDERAPTALNALVGHVDTVHVMAVLFAIGLTTFLAIEPTQHWLLLLLSGLSALGTEGIIRSHPQGRSQRLDDTALFMIVPVLFTLAVGLFLEEVAEGFWTLTTGFLAGIPFWGDPSRRVRFGRPRIASLSVCATDSERGRLTLRPSYSSPLSTTSTLAW